MPAPVNSLMVYGATTFLTSEDGGDDSVSVDPVFLTAEMIDTAIANGTLQAGSFNNVAIIPSVADWPERWRFLKED